MRHSIFIGWGKEEKPKQINKQNWKGAIRSIGTNQKGVVSSRLSNGKSFKREDALIWSKVAEMELLKDANRKICKVLGRIEVSLTIIFNEVLWNNRIQVGMG